MAHPSLLIAQLWLAALILTPALNAATRIVDYGGDLGSGSYKNGVSTLHPEIAVDVDGDGETSDDSVGFWEYSLTEPLSPTLPPYDIEATNAIFYGGMTVFTTKASKGLIEGLLNENHELRDDWNMMTADNDKPPLRAYGLWFWKKEDFLNGGEQYTVSFGADAIIAPHISRYYDGVEDGRWVVRDGTQFYVSEKTFSEYLIEIGRTSPRHTSYILNPTETNWAPYNPQPPYHVEFDSSTATFTAHTFTDVTAVGFTVYADTLRSEDIGVKWHSFEAYADIARPSDPSYHADLVSIPAGNYQGQSIPSFNIGRTEVPYSLWKKVWKWAVSNQYAFDLNPGYSFNKDGDMGSMDLGGSHHATEPATDMTWMDAVLWCNALSELEGRTPCYYADSSLTEVLRTIQQRDYPANYDNEFAVYVDWTSDGFRLPTMLEWSYAAEAGTGGFSSATTEAWTGSNASGSTQPVGQLNANPFGLQDAAGNVWEYTWDIPAAGAYFDPVTNNDHTVLGGGIHFPEDRSSVALFPYGDEPHEGSPIIGIRIAQSNGSIPPTAQATGVIPTWTITQGQVIAGTAPQTDPTVVSSTLSAKISGTHTYGIQGEDDYEDDNIGFLRDDDAFVRLTPYYLSKNEITYQQWNQIYQWGIRNGYTFDRDGDLGSMDWQTGQHSHSPDEPVTDIGWYDAVLWCNAASEYEGRAPVYYADTDRTIVLRSATRWRIRMESRPNYNTTSSEQQTELYPRWENNGYRLPTSAEWEAAIRDGNETKNLNYPWTNGEADATNYGWIHSNSGGKTHPVSSLPTNNYGINDLCGNVSEWVWDWPGLDYYQSHNPKGGKSNTLFGKVVRGDSYATEVMRITENDEERESGSRSFYGFRVARCDSGEHSEDTTFVPEVVLNLDAADFEMQQDKLFRYNNWRTGYTSKAGVPNGPVGVRWSFTTNGVVESSPVMVNNVVYIGSNDGKVYAINAQTGAIIWSYDTGTPVQCAPAVVDGTVFIGSDDYLYALNASDGSLNWQYTRGGTSTNVTNAPAVAYGMVFSGFGRWSTSGYSGIDIATGQEVWRYRLGAANNGPMGPTIAGTNLYAPFQDNACLSADLRTEYPNWESNGHRSQACMAILDSDTVLYLQHHFLHARDRVDGSTLWTFDVGGGFDDKPQSSPAVGQVNINGSIETWAFVASLEGEFYAVDTTNGQMQWSYATGGPIKSSPTLANGRVYFGSDDGKLYVLDAATGAYVWSYDVGSSIKSSPWVTDGAVFFASDAGTIYAVEFSSGPPQIETTALDTIDVESSSSQQLNASGGTGILSWSLLLGKLPEGITLSSSGLLSGTALESGTFPITVVVTDEAFKSALLASTLIVNQTAMGTPFGLDAEISNRQIVLSWTDNASAETAYVLERRDVTDRNGDPFEVIIDNRDEQEVGTGTLQMSGYWNGQTWGSNAYGTYWGGRPATAGGTAYARYIPDLNGYEGNYEVFMWYPVNSNSLSDNMPIAITHDGGVSTQILDGNEGGQWVSLGNYDLSTTAQVEITNNYTPIGGVYSYIDAIRFLRADGSGPWVTLSNTLSPDSIAYTDEFATAGRVYEYRVSAIDGSTQTAYSNSPELLFVNRPAVETGGWNLFQPVYWSKGNHYTDKMLSSSVWGNNWQDYSYPVDAYGIPNSIPEGTAPATKVTLDAPGDYVLTWEGTGSVSLDPVNNADVVFVSEDLSQSPYRRVYTKLSAIDEAELARVFIDATDAQDPVHSIHLWAPGYEPATGTDPDSIFTDAFKGRISENFAVLRFMDWIRTNNSTEQIWSDRRSPDWYTQQYPVAYEHMIALCNELEKDMWISIPHLADDDYVQRLAHLIRTGESNGVTVCEPLASHLKVYVEWSNEVWNGSFAQNTYLIDQVEASSGLPSSDSSFPWGDVYALTGEHAAECWQIFMAEFDTAWPDRIVRVLGTQTGGHLIDSHMIGVNRVPNVEPDVVAIAGYFGYTFFRYAITELNYTNPSATDWENAFIELQRIILEEDKTKWEASVDAAAVYNLPIVAYEGGQHVVGLYEDNNNDGIWDIEDTDLTNFLGNLNRDDRMGDLIALTMDIWEEIGAGLFVAFNDCSPYDQYGSWGFYDGWDKSLINSPKAEAFETWLYFQQQSHIKTYLLDEGAIGYLYNFTLDSEIKEAPAYYSLASGALPLGISLSSSGTLSGIPQESGNFPIEIQLTDSKGDIDLRSYDLYIKSIADPTVFEPTEDTFVANWVSTPKDTLTFSLTGSDLSRTSLVKWDLSSLSGRSLTSATLHLDLLGSAGSDTTISLYNNDASSWTADTVVWSTRPSEGTLASSLTVNTAGHYTVDILTWLQSVQENGTVGISIQAESNLTLSTSENSSSSGVYLEVEYAPDQN